ncbi:MAG: transcription elongation factor GreA [Eubacteriales bacterium]|nr:transcription elongation factor GreA [Eubacteriales bacterium]
MPTKLHNTEAGLRALKEELDYLKNTKRNEVKENLAVARSFGDLSENSEYDEARNEQAKVEARISELEQIILHTVVVPEGAVDSKVIHLGSTVLLLDESKNLEKTYILVGSNEANPDEGKISDRSPIGVALVGKHIGDEAVVTTPRGDKKYKILDVKRTAKE